MSSYVLLYVELEKEFETASASALGWIAAIAWGLSSMMSVVTSPLYDKYGHTKCIIFGVCATFTGILGTTFAHQLWVMYITFGIILGAGFNFVYNPSMNIITCYFPKIYCTRATSGATMGSAVGLLALCPLLDIGFSTIGWRNTYRILAGVYLLISMPMCMLMKPPHADYHKQIEADLKAIEADDKDAENSELNPAKTESKEKFEKSMSSAETNDSNKWKKYSELNPAKTDSKEKMEKFMSSAAEINDGSNKWKKYKDLMCLPQHWLFFFGVCGATICAISNVISLGSLLSHSGYSKNDAAFLITAMTISELGTRFLLTAFGDCLPCARAALFPIACFLASVSSLALGLYQNYAVVIAYIAIAGISRGIMFGLPYGVAVEVFGASRSVEVYTSLLLSFGIGGLSGSLVPGLSFDLTGSYIASLHIGAGLWLICALLTTALYISYSQSRLRNQYTIPDSDISEDSCDVKHIPVHDLNEGYILLGNDDVQKTANMRVVVTTAVSSEQKGHDIISKGYVNMSCAYIKTDKKVGVTFGDPWVEKVSVV